MTEKDYWIEELSDIIRLQRYRGAKRNHWCNVRDLEGVDCTLSESVTRNDSLHNKVVEVNEKLRDIFGKDTQIIEHSYIKFKSFE